jgi:hypothetical protein
MAYSYIWPVGLPQKPQENYNETGGVIVLRTPMDRGPAKQRRIGKRIQTMQVSFHMTPAQVELLRVFVEDTLRGTARFGFPHPRTNAIVEARIPPQSGGMLYSVNYVMYTVYSVSMDLEILP